MTFDFRDKRPDKYSDRARWNESWEHDLESTYTGIGLRGVPPHQLTPQDRQFLSMLGPSSNLYAERASREIVELQQDLSEFAVKKIAVDDFRAKWKALPSARREELVLEALFQASIASPDTEAHRRWCPEMTITFLAGPGEEGFLTLLMKFIQDTITAPILVPHMHVERIFETEPYSLTLAKHGRLHRAYFISLVLWRVLLAFVRRIPFTYDSLLDIFSAFLNSMASKRVISLARIETGLMRWSEMLKRSLMRIKHSTCVNSDGTFGLCTKEMWIIASNAGKMRGNSRSVRF